jgi:hypothetical protein
MANNAVEANATVQPVLGVSLGRSRKEPPFAFESGFDLVRH